MRINVLTLPRNASNNICYLLDRITLLEMRLVSKSSKIIVNNLLGTRKSTLVVFYTFCRRNTSDHELYFRFGCSRECILCKIISISKFGLREMKGFKLEDKRRTTTNKEIKLNLKENVKVIAIFEFLKEHLLDANVSKVSLVNLNSEILKICSNFLDRMQIKSIVFETLENKIFDFSFLIERFRKWNISSLDYQGPKSTESIEFLYQAADLVKTLEISFLESVPLPRNEHILREVLSRKVQNLIIFHELDLSLTITDIERLVQCFHHLERKVMFKIWTDRDLTNVLIGNYRVKTHRPIHLITISHLDLNV